MVSSVTALVLATALGQAGARGSGAGTAAEAAWLKVVPAEAEIVVRVRGLKAGRDDLAKMIEAMSPNLSAQALPSLNHGLDQFRQRYGDAAATQPFLVLVRLPKGQVGPPQGPPPVAFVVEAKDYNAVVKHASGLDDVKPEKQSGGYDKFDSKEGPMYAAKSGSFVAFGSDEALVKAFAKPTATLDKSIDRTMAVRLFTGDVGLFVNLAAIRARFGDDIEKAQQTMNEQIAKQAEHNPSAGAVRPVINGLFEVLKNNKAAALSLDFDVDGLTIAGDTLAVTPKKAAAPVVGDPIGKLPGGAAVYVLVRGANASVFENFQRIGQAMTTGDPDSAAAKKARELQRAADLREQTTAISAAPKSRPVILNVALYGDPRKAVDAMTADLQATASEKGVVKKVDIKAGEQRYRGFTLNHATLTPNIERIKQLNPAAPVAGLADKPTQTWFGTDGKVVVSIAAPSWEQARARLDAYLDAKQTLGQQAAYKTLRQALPRSPGLLVLAEAQGVVHLVESLIGMVQGRDVPAATLPEEPAFFGLAVAPTETGTTFQFRLPSVVGPVLEQGILPLLQGIQAGDVKQ
ncbi:MAG TPA: hypothetical protein VG406_01175 [Isosphaeraceae bacterium]|jgi:hypothetical protein|nr:hypothetical protein [Isosphaeraceae bacterium]